MEVAIPPGSGMSRRFGGCLMILLVSDMKGGRQLGYGKDERTNLVYYILTCSQLIGNILFEHPFMKFNFSDIS